MTTAGPQDEAAREYGSQIITALEQAWSAIRDQHPGIPDVVIVTGAGSNQKGLPKGYALRGHHWPGRWVTDPAEPRMPELFMAGELLAAGGRAVLEVMLHEAAHALAAVRGIKDTSAEGNRYHNKRFMALAAEMGLRGPAGPRRYSAGQTAGSPTRPPPPTPTSSARSTPPGCPSCRMVRSSPAGERAVRAGERTVRTARARTSRRSAAAAAWPSSARASRPASCI